MATATIHWQCWQPSTITLRDFKFTVAVGALQPARARCPLINQNSVASFLGRTFLCPGTWIMHRLSLSVVVSRDASAVSEASQRDYDERPKGNWVLCLRSRRS